MKVAWKTTGIGWSLKVSTKTQGSVWKGKDGNFWAHDLVDDHYRGTPSTEQEAMDWLMARVLVRLGFATVDDVAKAKGRL